MRRTYQTILLLILIAVVPLGLASKVYHGPLEVWVNQFAGDILYEIFWIVLICLIWTRLSPLKVAIGVFLVTSALEVLQLWHPPFLQAIRSTFLGRTLLGTTFAWADFPHYAFGCILSWLGLRYLESKILSSN